MHYKCLSGIGVFSFTLLKKKFFKVEIWSKVKFADFLIYFVQPMLDFITILILTESTGNFKSALKRASHELHLNDRRKKQISTLSTHTPQFLGFLYFDTQYITLILIIFTLHLFRLFRRDKVFVKTHTYFTLDYFILKLIAI